MSAYKNILITKKGETCHISLNRPKKLNALSSTTLKEISNACEEIALNKKSRLSSFLLHRKIFQLELI